MDGPFFLPGVAPVKTEATRMPSAAMVQLRDTFETPCDRDPIRTLFCLTLGEHDPVLGRQAVNENICWFDCFICSEDGLGVLPRRIA